MGLLSVIVLILITLVGFSTGIVLAVRDRQFLPMVVDLVAVILLWVVVFWLRPQLNHWLLLGVALLLGIVVGYVLLTFRLIRSDTTQIIPKSELPEHAREHTETAIASNIFKRIWQSWNLFGARMGNVQARLLMGMFYFFIVSPFGILARLFTDPLSIRQSPASSGWVNKEPTDITVAAAREQG